ncbi:hypothetical protein [Hyalangium minutum]|uniref:DUF2268 domain-containing protein n=1 Tax=Hyalangium minutum TaxID=394096 RepID=A0A085VSN4_9BACT|nr:hypothetical protein [Hyalangium minutum]KFE58447.1 hypothetical protein DB31_6713 [Hyalangium minutum]KFE60685.1 hypothetical protein DB31_4867 [Hyalangium minutum]
MLPQRALLRALPQVVCLAMLCCVPSATVPARASPSTYRVVDAMPTFWQYWEQAQGLEQAEQVRLFREQVVAAHPALYTAEVLGFDAKQPFEAELARRYPKYWQWVSPHFDTMRRLSEELRQKLPFYEARFRQTFPDLNYTGEIYFLNSLGAFDGATRQVKGRTALLFGVDVIAAIYGPTADAESFFDHELFHIYQEQFSDLGTEDTVAGALWHEGLATYVAQALNPGVSERMVFGLPEEMPARARALLPKLAAELRVKLDSKSPEDYQAFFLGNSPRQDIPARSGYFVGYLVARELARTRPLAELAHLHGSELRTAMEEALRQME